MFVQYVHESGIQSLARSVRELLPDHIHWVQIRSTNNERDHACLIFYNEDEKQRVRERLPAGDKGFCDRFTDAVHAFYDAQVFGYRPRGKAPREIGKAERC